MLPVTQCMPPAPPRAIRGTDKVFLERLKENMRRDPYGYGGAVAAVLCTSVNDKESFKLSMKGGYRYVRTYNELYSIVCLIRICGKHDDRNMQQYTSQKNVMDVLQCYCIIA